MKRHLGALLFITSFGLLGIKALFPDGLYTAHDIWHNVARFYWFSEAVKAGQFLPAWIAPMANGYGYPLFIFSYHLPWIIGTPLILAQVPLQIALKIVLGLSFFVSGLTMYSFAFRLFQSRLAGVVAAIVYMWTPYHFLTLFVAAAAGIAWAYALLPLIFWGLWEISLNNKRLGISLAAIGLAGVVLSHLILAAMIMPFVVVWIMVTIQINRRRKKYTLIYQGVSLLLGFGLAAYYLLPFMKYSPLIKANDPGLGFRTLYQNNFATLKQLFYSPWGYGPITTNAKDGEISLQVGIAQWMGMIGAILLFIKKPRYRLMLGLLLGIFALCVFAVSEYSKPIWDFFATKVALDYPFRLLILAGLFGALLVGSVEKIINQKYFKLVGAGLFLIIALYTNKNHIRVNLYTHIPIQDYVQSEKTTNTMDEYLPLTAERKLINQPRINSWTQWAFPGQTVTIDNRKVEYQTNRDGLIEVENFGQKPIQINYNKGWVFKIGNTISLLTLIIIGVYVFISPAARFRRHAGIQRRSHP